MTARCPVDHTAATAQAPGLRVVHRSALRTGLALVRDPFRALETLPSTGDIVVTSVFGQPTVVLAHPAPVADMLREGRGTWIKDRLTQRTADVFGRGLLLSEGDAWRRQRRASPVPAIVPSQPPCARASYPHRRRSGRSRSRG